MDDKDRNEIRVILAELKSQNITGARVERILGLPKRTIPRWKRGQGTASGLALLRMVNKFPWMIDDIDKSGWEPKVDESPKEVL